MDEASRRAVASVSSAFDGAKGPARFKYSESGPWYEREGKEIVEALLNLNPTDIRFDEVVHPLEGTFVPVWADSEGPLWLIPGIIHEAFEIDPQKGDHLIQCLFSELNKRILKEELTLNQQQAESLLEAHETFYCEEEFDWDSDAHGHPLCESLRNMIR